MITPYLITSAFASILREKWINLLSVLTIATGLMIIATAVFVTHNAELATRNLPERLTVTVFLKNNLQEPEVQGIIGAVRRNPVVKDVLYISKEEALAELRGLIENADEILEGLNENPLPPSLEISLRPEAVTSVSVKQLAEDVRRQDGVDEVEYGEKVLASIQSIKSGVEAVGFSVIAALSVGIIFVCYSTVKILFYRKKDEIDTLQLLGATGCFIRTPFIIEGSVIGLLGGIIAAAGMYGLKYGIDANLASVVPLAKSLVFPPLYFAALPCAGLLIGLIGAVIAIGRMRF